MLQKVLGFALLSLVHVLVVLPVRSGPSEDRRPGQAAGKPAATDRHGDALPRGAIARMGSLRLKHKYPVTCVAFAPDGQTLASGGDDGGVCIWDASTGKEIHRLRTVKNDV